MVVEFASPAPNRRDTRPDALRNAPAWAIRRINQARVRSGLPAIQTDIGDESIAAGVRWDPASPHRPKGGGLIVTPRAGGPGPFVTRVLLVVAHGDAPGSAIGRARPESIARGAFGPASAINAERGWGLVSPGHDGPMIARGGPAGQGRLVAHDTEVGMVLEWLPDLSDRRHVEALQMIEAGASASVLMQPRAVRTLPLDPPVDIVTSARLINVAIVTKPAYRGAAVMIFRNVRRDDRTALREQLAAVAREAAFRARRAAGRAV